MNSTDAICLGALLVIVFVYRNLDKIKAFIADQFFDNDPALAIDANGSRDIAHVLTANNKNYLILYGSQTGTAEDYARKFGKELTARFHLNVMCADLENFDFDSLNSLPEGVIATFVISTYGEGDFPDGAVNFEQYLNEVEDSPDALDNLRFSIFGLGNTTYEFYNGAAKKALEKLTAAGAQLIGEMGVGDDGAGTTDEDYMAWKDETMGHIAKVLDLHEQEQEYTPSFTYTKLESLTDSVSLGEPAKQYLPPRDLPTNATTGKQRGPFDLALPYVAPITASRELFQSADRNCIHTEFDISGSEITYETGDHLAIWPSNATEKVQQFLSVFQLDGDEIFDLTPLDATIKPPFLCPTTIAAAVTHYIEITGPISRQSLGLLATYAPAEIKDRVTALSKDKDLFSSEILAKKFNLADALLYLNDNKPWEGVPWTLLIELLPKLLPRYYSISSSALAEPTVIHATSIVENTPNEATGHNTVGVTTNLLRELQLAKSGDSAAQAQMPVHYALDGPRGLYHGGKLPVHVRHSTFRLPSNLAVPVIMIGPGTGVAPFRGFVRERAKMAELDPELLPKMGKMFLFYGSRDESDYLYRDEWVQHATTLGDKFEIDVALSRAQAKKVYVQHRLAQRKEEVAQLLNSGAHVYVCGDAKRMARDVQRALADILAAVKDISPDEGQEIIKAMKVAGRYQEDIW
ncbi:hypothetical protein DAKH74_056190 [Maudiozyma humilis]|uniref:NADPH--cytochrome P450 reductase n=1 Tax=Maudiozyma humilis TaxID=51915 RepID=A0AAV5SBF6_MAUHU|nr:hypothetical protein DAKH74_056190 [Kazachstania humilis]